MLSTLRRRPLSIACIVLLVSAAFAELAFRLLGFGNPLLYRASASGYEVAPNQAVTRLFKTLRYNSDGLRNDPVAPVPSSGIERVICLGDSITYGGSEVDNSGTYTGQLQKLTPGVEVLNASAGGWSVINESRWLSAHGSFASSVIVLEVGENDLFQPYVESTILDKHPAFPSRPPKSAIIEVVTRYVLPRLGLGPTLMDPGAAGSTLDPAAARDVLDAVEKIHEYAMAQGARLIILYMDPARPSDDSRMIAARDRLLAWAQQSSIALVRPELAKRQSEDRRLFRDALHPNEDGNAVIAEELAHALSRGS